MNNMTVATIINLLRNSERPVSHCKLMGDAANALSRLEKREERARGLLFDALTVLNAHSVGYKTQEAIERFLEIGREKE